jgi:hypothetical protein
MDVIPEMIPMYTLAGFELGTSVPEADGKPLRRQGEHTVFSIGARKV